MFSGHHSGGGRSARQRVRAKAMQLLTLGEFCGVPLPRLVHLDLKPENLMMFNGRLLSLSFSVQLRGFALRSAAGRLKLIDVDGCVPCGSEVSIQAREPGAACSSLQQPALTCPWRSAPFRIPPFPFLLATARQSGPGAKQSLTKQSIHKIHQNS